MEAKDFKVAALVWAKMRGFPPWPARIAQPTKRESSKPKKSQHYVYFFGTRNFAWISDKHIFPHSEEMLACFKSYKKKSTAMQNAIQEIEKKTAKVAKKDQLIPIEMIKKEEDLSNSSFPQLEITEEESKIPKLRISKKNIKIEKTIPRVSKKTIKIEKNPRVSKKNIKREKKTPRVSKKNIKREKKIPRVPEKNIKREKKIPRVSKKNNRIEKKIPRVAKKNNRIEKKIPRVSKKSIQIKKKIPRVSKKSIQIEKKIPRVSKKNNKIEKNSRKRKASDMIPDDSEVEEDYSQLIANVPPNNGPNVAIIPPYNEDSNVNLYSSFINQPFTDGPVTQSLFHGNSAKTVKRVPLIATTKKIGFLGLGVMGCKLVKNLLSSGHYVTIWNRTMIRECNDLVNAGARRGQTVADVIRMSDITFSCVSDPEASKAIVFLKNGVLEGLNGLRAGSKSYVELTSIDPVTSQELSEAIAGKGGLYLEAPMCGSRQNATNGTLVVLTAGNLTLFTECETCFASFGTNAFYLGCEVGNASKMNLILSMLAGTTYAALGEAMALIERCEIPQSFFLEVLGVGPLSCPLLLNKGYAMVTNDYAVNTPLQHQQKDMTLALSLGDISEQPLSLSVAASELYKLAKRRFINHDVSAIHLCAKL